MKKENKLQARKRKAAQKKKQAMRKWLYLAGAVLLVLLIGTGVGYAIYRSEQNANAPVSRNFSKYLTKDGKIKGVRIEDCVDLCDLREALQFAADEIRPSAEAVESAMEDALSSYWDLKEETGTVLENGDWINLDYVGYVDGEAFDGGNTNGAGTRLKLGSGSYIDDFEEQLIGHAVGDKVNVEVTFPDPYESNPDLAGKDALFEVVINGVYDASVTDELVSEHIDGCSTAEEYRSGTEQELYDSNLSNAVWTAIMENSEIITVPEKYADNLYELQTYAYQMQYNMANQMYYSTYGTYGWSSMEQYFNMTSEQLRSMIQYYTSVDLTHALLCQAIAEREGVVPSAEDRTEFVTSLGYGADQESQAVSDYGANYLAQGAMIVAVEKYVESIAVVTE